jgi:hypothetical protein
MKTYPAINVAARHGRRAAIVIGVLIALIYLVAGVREGQLIPILAAFVYGIVAWAVARLLAELIEVIADTLLPR